MMNAVFFHPKQKKLYLEKIPRPKIVAPYDVLVKIFYSGVCSLDINAIEGVFKEIPDNPIIMGHEITGMVADVGEAVNLFKRGDKVVVDPMCSCGKCLPCYKARPHFCQNEGLRKIIGININGGWAEYIVVLEKQLFKVPESLTLEQAVMAQPLSCVVHAWDKLQPVSVEQKILIMGAGIAGILWAALLHLQGYRRVFISEPNLCRQDAFKKMDTGFECVSSDQLHEKKLLDPTFAFDLIIEACGNLLALENCVNFLDLGGTLLIYSVTSPEETIQISPFTIYRKELRVFGSNANPLSFPKSLAILECLGKRYISFEHLSIKTYSIEDYNDAIKDVRKSFILKAVFKMDISCTCKKMLEENEC